MDLQAVSVGLARAAGTAVAAGEKLTTVAFTPDSVVPPMCFVAEYDIDYDKAYGRGMDAVDFTLRVLVSRTDDLSGAQLLNDLLSGSGGPSLKEAIESERQNGPSGTGLAGACDDYHVRAVQGMRWYQHDQISYLGADIRVHVIGKGTT